MAPFGCYRVGGGYAGACEMPAAVVGSDTHSIVLEGAMRSQEVFDIILATLAFPP